MFGSWLIAMLSRLSLLTILVPGTAGPARPPRGGEGRVDAREFVLRPCGNVTAQRAYPRYRGGHDFTQCVSARKGVRFPPCINHYGRRRDYNCRFAPGSFFRGGPRGGRAFAGSRAVSCGGERVPGPLPASCVSRGVVQDSRGYCRTGGLFLFLSSRFNRATALSLVRGCRIKASGR